MRLLILSFFSFITHINIAQEGYLIAYNLDYVPDTTSLGKRISETFILKVKNETSYFVSQNKVWQDSIREEARKNQALALQLVSDFSKIPKTNFKYDIFISDNIIIQKEEIAGKEYYYEQPMNDFISWEIGAVIKEINGLDCQVASTTFGGREYEAWFSLALPIALGPYKFVGLPGLIVSINDIDNHYHFQMVGISQRENLEIGSGLRQRSKKITKEEYHRIKNKSKEFIVERAQQRGLILSEEGKRLLLQRQSEFNNPIERFE